MNFGKLYNEKEEKSLEEKIKDLEKIFPAIQEKIKNYDSVLIEYKEIKLKVDTVQNDILNSKKEFELLMQNKIDSIKLFFENLNLSQKEFNKLKKYVEDSKTEFSHEKSIIFDELKLIREILDQNKLMMTSLEQKIDNLPNFSNLNDLKNEISSQSTNCKNNFCQIELKISDIHKKLSSQFEPKDINRMLEEERIRCEKKIIESEYSLKNNFNLALDKVNQLFNNKYSELKKIVDSIIIPEIPSLDDAKKAMLSILEPVSYDAKNANLRSSNNESKMNLLDKKIEHAIILINQMKLKEVE